jgi:hypothetical protein
MTSYRNEESIRERIIMASTQITSMHKVAILQAHQFQGQRNDCAPFSIAMVTNALHGSTIVGEDLAESMNAIRFRGIIPIIRRIPNWATFPWGMVDVFKDLGIKASWRFLGNQERLKTSIITGDIAMPVIGGWIPPWGHVMALLAFDPSLGWGFANTAKRDAELHWMEDELFEQQWRTFGRMVVEVAHA